LVTFCLKTYKKLKKLLYIALLCLANSVLQAQEFPNINFRSITEKDGLSNNNVTDIIQDNEGFIWIATVNGLNRYDGIRMKNFYANVNDSTSLQTNEVATLSKDSSGNIWLIGPAGSAKMDKATRQFQNINSPTTSILHYKNSSAIFTYNGVLDYTNNKFIKNNEWKFTPIKYPERTYVQYEKVVPDKKGNLWSAVGTTIFKIINGNPANVIAIPMPEQFGVTSMIFDSQGRCWLTSWGGGLYELNTNNNTIKKIPIADKPIVSQHCIEWKWNNQNYIIVCNETNGISIVNTGNGRYKNIIIKENNLTDAHAIYVRNAYVDKKNNLWLSTGSGIKLATNFTNAFEVQEVYKNNLEDKNYWSNGTVYTIKEQPSGYWLSKRYFGGMFWYNKNWELQQFWPKVIPHQTYPYKGTVIGHEYEGYDFLQKGNTMYITTELGMGLLNLSNKNIQLITANDTTIPRLRTIVAINDSLWMIRSAKYGIYSFNPVKNKFSKYYRFWDEEVKKEVALGSIINTNDNKIYAITVSGNMLYSYNPSADDFDKINITGLPNADYYTMAIDGNQLLWLGSSKGLMAVDLKKQAVVKTFTDYADMGTVSRLTVDGGNNIWFNCKQGYWCWQQNNNKMIKYNYELGLPSNADFSAFTTLSNNQVVAGGLNAIVKFNSINYNNDLLHAKTAISEVKVNNELVTAKRLNDSTYQLNLLPNENNLDINFSVLDYSNKDNYDYYYTISPGSSNWIKTADGHLGLNNLSYGNYTIQLKGANNISNSTSSIATLKLYIKPKWHQTVWVRLLGLFTLLAIIYGWIKYRTSQIKNTAQLKIGYENKMLQLEMQNLRSQMNPHFIFNSLNSINSFIVENKTHLASDYLTKFSRLMRLILDNSKNEIITLEKELETLRLYLLMESVRFTNKFDYTITVQPGIDEQLMKLPPMIIQPYVENAIWHGLLHKEEKGQVLITITKQNNNLQIVVQDNGIGRNKAAEIKSKNLSETKSYGMQITAQRLQQLNAANSVTTEDITDNNGNISGTKVIINITATE
jgi:ligand-binding sensor domain-containing protein